jgi:hypothetical protein
VIIAGSDVVGDQTGEGEHNYIAMIFADEDIINRIHKDVGIKEIHMVKLEEREKKQVIQNLNVTYENCMSFCLHVERQHTVDYIEKHPRINNKWKPKNKIQKHFDFLLYRQIKERLETFLFKHGCRLEDITMHCDGDMDHTAENWKMKREYKGKSHELTDAIAYLNHRKIPLENCIHLDLREDLRIQMERDMIK